MSPLTDGIRPRRFPIVNAAIIAACFAPWIPYVLPHPTSSVREPSLYACDVNESCDSLLPWTVSWFTAMFMHGSSSHILGDMCSWRSSARTSSTRSGGSLISSSTYAGRFAALRTNAAGLSTRSRLSAQRERPPNAPAGTRLGRPTVVTDDGVRTSPSADRSERQLIVSRDALSWRQAHRGARRPVLLVAVAFP
jgi:hypothetical protein